MKQQFGTQSSHLLQKKQSSRRNDSADLIDLDEAKIDNVGYIDTMKAHQVQRFNLLENKDFTVHSQVARNYINRQIDVKERVGPYQFRLIERKRLQQEKAGGIAQLQRQGVFVTKSRGDRNKVNSFDTLNKKREQTSALRIGVQKLGHYESSPKKLTQIIERKQVRDELVVRREIGKEADNQDVFVPDMIDYEKVIKTGLARLQMKNYDSWSMLIKLCFDNPTKKNAARNKPNGQNSTVNPVELMRFHPILNKFEISTVKLILAEAQLVKLNANTLLYGCNDKSENWYFILFGALILH